MIRLSGKKKFIKIPIKLKYIIPEIISLAVICSFLFPGNKKEFIILP
tara:strand:+ start:1270 stop:1410 length:141 start_codon:yes stop_codon:yes gene_type:complete